MAPPCVPIALLSISPRGAHGSPPPAQVRKNFSLEFGGIGQPTRIDAQLMPLKSVAGRPCIAKAKGHIRKASKADESTERPVETAKYPELFLTQD